MKPLQSKMLEFLRSRHATRHYLEDTAILGMIRAVEARADLEPVVLRRELTKEATANEACELDELWQYYQEADEGRPVSQRLNVRVWRRVMNLAINEATGIKPGHRRRARQDREAVLFNGKAL